MPGQTDNTDHLAAFNQVIQALNDLQLGIETGDPPTNIAAILGDIQNNIESLEATWSARSIAAVTAQNTNFADLIAALDAWVPVRPIRGGGCCCSASIESVPSQPAVEGSSPPTYGGWETPTGAPTPTTPGTTVYYDRKCEISNMLHSDLYNFCIWADSVNLDGLPLEMALGLIGYVIGEAIIPNVWFLDGAAGTVLIFAVDLALTIVGEDVTFADLVTALDAYAQDLVCALYNSTTATDALGDYLTVLNDNGVTLGNQAVVSAIYLADIVNYLYFVKDGYVESLLADYTPPYPCDVCGCEDYIWPLGNDITPGTHNWASAWDGQTYKIFINLCVPDAFNITFNSITGYTDVPNKTDWRLFSGPYTGDSSPGDIYNSVGTPPPLAQQYNGVGALVLWSADPAFSVNVTIS